MLKNLDLFGLGIKTALNFIPTRLYMRAYILNSEIGKRVEFFYHIHFFSGEIVPVPLCGYMKVEIVV